jgi:hypothetical protein
VCIDNADVVIDGNSGFNCWKAKKLIPVKTAKEESREIQSCFFIHAFGDDSRFDG